ncbi:MAG: permease [Candidatus Margulisiibacteriota bacterium]
MVIDPICGMQVDEKTGLKIEHNGETVYFCSAHCKQTYITENEIPGADESSSSTQVCDTCAVGVPLYKNKAFILSVITALAYLSGYVFPFLGKFRMILGMYLGKIAIPIVLGLLLGGVIEWLVPREYISKILAPKKKRTVVFAVFTGFLMSACSHGILALAIQLHKKGASAPAVVAFLLASPWANLPITILMFGFFGCKALLIIFSAIIIAIITGWIYLVLERSGWVESNPNTVAIDSSFSITADIKQKLKKTEISGQSSIRAVKSIWKGSLSLANMVLWWILIGALLSSIAGAFIPESFMKAYMGTTILGLLVTLLIATVLEICSEGTAPLAFEIYRQTGAFGNAFVFLMAGVVTDYTEIGLLWSNVGPKTALWLPVLTVPQVVLLGWIFNTLIIN